MLALAFADEQRVLLWFVAHDEDLPPPVQPLTPISADSDDRCLAPLSEAAPASAEDTQL